MLRELAETFLGTEQKAFSGVEPAILREVHIVFDQVALGELDSATWRHVIAVNVESALWLAQSFAPGMAERGFGRIIFVISWLDRTIAAVRIAPRAVRRIPAS